MVEKNLLVQTVLSVSVVVGGGLLGLAICAVMEKFAARHQIKRLRTLYLQKFVHYTTGLTIVLLLCLVWGINLAGAWVFLTSVFGIIGIALFAQWSILSNITACFILFFSAPFKIDDVITVKDGDNSAHGQVIDMTLFYVRLQTPENQLVNLPNSLMIQKAVETHRDATPQSPVPL